MSQPPGKTNYSDAATVFRELGLEEAFIKGMENTWGNLSNEKTEYFLTEMRNAEERTKAVLDGLASVSIQKDDVAEASAKDLSAEKSENRKGVRQAPRWYSVSVLSNFEKKVAEEIRLAVEEEGLEETIEEILVPTEEIIEVRRGKKVSTERRFMPGYVLVRMQMSDRGYQLVTSINRVTGFLGPQGRPMPMRDAEADAILGRVEEGHDAPRLLISFQVGDKVRVNDGPFEGFDGTIERVDPGGHRLRVKVSIFGRATAIELEPTQVRVDREN